MAANLRQRIPSRPDGKSYVNSPARGLVLFVSLCALQGCATPQTPAESASQAAIIGKTKQELLQCAGTPIREASEHAIVTFSYYKEAPMLQESFPASKGSFPRPHHGCWATVLLKEERVMDIEYRSVPDTIDGVNLCEAIFTSCLSQ